jgi:spermidine/putrescine transport system permease protein
MKKFKQQLSNSFFFSIVPGVLWQLLFLYLPLAFMIGLSFFEVTDKLIAPTLHYYYVATSSFHLLVIMRSLFVSFFVATICSFIAYPVAYFIAFRVSKGWQNIGLFLLALPFWINFLLQIYAWCFILERNGVINLLLLKVGLIKEPLYIMNTMFAVILVMVQAYLPFMILPIYSGMSRFSKRLIEASYDLGASATYTFWHITLPLTISGIKTGFILILVMTFGEFTIPTLLGGGKKLFVGTLVSEYFFTLRSMSQGSAFVCVSGFMLCLAIYIINKIFVLISGTQDL